MLVIGEVVLPWTLNIELIADIVGNVEVPSHLLSEGWWFEAWSLLHVLSPPCLSLLRYVNGNSKP